MVGCIAAKGSSALVHDPDRKHGRGRKRQPQHLHITLGRPTAIGMMLFTCVHVSPSSNSATLGLLKRFLVTSTHAHDAIAALTTNSRCSPCCLQTQRRVPRATRHLQRLIRPRLRSVHRGTHQRMEQVRRLARQRRPHGPASLWCAGCLVASEHNRAGTCR